MFRSRTDPMMDWGNPDTLLGVFSSATRKSYSGTLDLLSLSYRPGENFAVNLKLYAAHLWHSFGALGGLLALGGFIGSWRRQRALTLWFVGVFAITGPVFLFLANMPPNPHAIAIVEASYLIPDVIVAIGIGFAVNAAFVWKRELGLTVLAAALLSIASHVPASFERADKRNNFYGRDYASNIFRGLPANAVAVFHKDVQLFTLWSAQLLEGRRHDVTLISTGLSASPWFWDMHRRWNVAECPPISLKDSTGWKQLKTAIGSRPLIVGYDVDLPPDTGLTLSARGYAGELSDAAAPFDADAARIFTSFSLNRGRAVYGGTPDFFSTDLIADMARALHQTGISALTHGNAVAAAFYFGWAEYSDPAVPRPWIDSGYLCFIRGDYNAARAFYLRAIEKARARMALAQQYKSLPEVVANCASDLSLAWVQLGATLEKLGQIADARDAYLRSLGAQENAQAHYNLAVTYWGKDWPQVIAHMRRALELNPTMNEARIYLDKAVALGAKK
jgi:hypothetical protein